MVFAVLRWAASRRAWQSVEYPQRDRKGGQASLFQPPATAVTWCGDVSGIAIASATSADGRRESSDAGLVWHIAHLSADRDDERLLRCLRFWWTKRLWARQQRVTTLTFLGRETVGLAGLLAGSAQINCAHANSRAAAILMVAAERWPACQSLLIDWPSLEQAGMAERSASEYFLQTVGQCVIAVEAGLRALGDTLDREQPREHVVSIRPGEVLGILRVSRLDQRVIS